MTKGLDIASVIVVKLLFIDDGQLIGFKLGLVAASFVSYPPMKYRKI